MKRKILSYTTLITLLAPTIIGLQQVHAEPMTIESQEETIETVDTLDSTDSTSEESSNEFSSETTEESVAVTQDTMTVESQEQTVESSIQTEQPAIRSTAEGITYSQMFPDENMRAAVMEKLGETSENEAVDQAALNKTYSLNISNKNIQSLEGIQYFENLSSLYIAGNNISDITQIGKLSKLQFLICLNNTISDFTPLEKLSELRFLEMGANPVSSLSSVSKITSLKELYCIDVPAVNDLSPIVSLTNLEVIFVQGCNVTDISPLASLPNLKSSSVATRITLPAQTVKNNQLIIPISAVQITNMDGSSGKSEKYYSQIGTRSREMTYSNESFVWNDVENQSTSPEMELKLVYDAYYNESNFKHQFMVTFVPNYELGETEPSSTTELESSIDSTTEEISTPPSSVESTTQESETTEMSKFESNTKQNNTSKSSITSSNVTKDSTNTDKIFPQTGSNSTSTLAMLGAVLITTVGISFVRNKFGGNRKELK